MNTQRRVGKYTLLLIMFFAIVSQLPKKVSAIGKDGFDTRTKSELNMVHQDLSLLFPEEYHYVVDYEKKQINKKIINPKIIFEDTRKVGVKKYTLTVYNNRQVLLAEEENLTPQNNNILRITDAFQVTKKYKLGDIGHYNTFIVTYTVNRYSYDVIDSWDIKGSGFYLYPYNYRHKDYEDSKGNAYRSYVNSSMYYNGSGVLYDLGVVVGHDSSKGVCRLSTGVDAFITYLLNPFIWGD